MAKVAQSLDVSNDFILVNADPSSDDNGVQAKIGCVAILVISPFGMYQKQDNTPTSWVKISA